MKKEEGRRKNECKIRWNNSSGEPNMLAPVANMVAADENIF